MSQSQIRSFKYDFPNAFFISAINKESFMDLLNKMKEILL